MMKSENATTGAIPPTAAVPSDSFNDSMTPAPEQAANEFAAVEKVRRRFMEVMVFHPQLEAKDGNASITVPLADNITNWSLQAVANSMEGHIGSGSGSIQVFQEFFVDFDAPWNLAVGDEAGIPVTISNYLKKPQTERLQGQTGDWYALSDGD